MRRRDFITLLGGAAAAWPIGARAQQGERMRLVGIVTPFSDGDKELQSLVAVFRRRLTELGWSEGRNIHIDYCGTSGDAGRLDACAAELATTPPTRS